MTAAGVVGDWQDKWAINQEKLNAELDDLELKVRRALFAAKRDERAALLARLSEPDVRRAVEVAINEQRALEAGGCFNPSDDTQGECADGDCYCTKQVAREAEAAIARIEEMLK